MRWGPHEPSPPWPMRIAAATSRASGPSTRACTRPPPRCRPAQRPRPKPRSRRRTTTGSPRTWELIRGCGGVKAAGHGAQQRQGEEVSIGRAFSSRAVKASGVWTQRSSDDAPETGYGGSGLVRVGKSEGGHEDGEEVRTAHTKPKHGRRRRARERVKQNVTKGELLLSPRQWSMRARA